ncbi:hypothetical protein [Frankia sp. R82]|uniref:hypothetical protein n=1 Tax=Frankia sp. R82 TaxID=2950553 RepID=UPI002044BECA|nr:hypothetical protein [Frankia sp. R82]MCM3882911.1 hypothetical protein [Frankia sp. R82]
MPCSNKDAAARPAWGQELFRRLAAGADALLDNARAHCVIQARARGLPRPVQSIHAALADPAGLRRTTRAGRAAGFFGRTAVHPAQLPTPREVRAARELVARLRRSADAGRGALATADGDFVDAAVVRRATSLLALADRFGTDPTLMGEDA